MCPHSHHRLFLCLPGGKEGEREGRSLWHIIIIIIILLFTLVNDLEVMVRALGAKTRGAECCHSLYPSLITLKTKYMCTTFHICSMLTF